MNASPLDLLAGARWECGAVEAGAAADPAALAALAVSWIPAPVPGTVAGAVRDSGDPFALERDYDTHDWWYRCELELPESDATATEPGAFQLSLDGLATLAEVFCDGLPIGRSDSMFRSATVPVKLGAGRHEIAVRFAALERSLAERRPRPRWKTNLVTNQNLRWHRTSLLGRVPGWAKVPAIVGPWRGLRLLPDTELGTPSARLTTAISGEDGVVTAVVRYRQPESGPAPLLSCAGRSTEMSVRRERDLSVAEATLVVPAVRRWWPATHGEPVLYPAEVTIGDRTVWTGSLGFRTIEADQSDGGFALVVNGERIFCRGATWFPPDPVAFAATDADIEHLLRLALEANLNIVRVAGMFGWEEPRFFEACDRLGLLVWQECPFAFVDPPSDPAFLAEVEAEARQQLEMMSGHPSAAVVCGSQQTEEIPAMHGLEADRYVQPLLDDLLPSLARELLPGTVWARSNPTGGGLPFQMNAGISQYFGIGGYLRPLDDVRRAGVRFAAECLALATPPAPATVDSLGGPQLAGHDPRWKLAVHHDAGRSWDMDDVRDFYTAELYGCDPLRLRYEDGARALDVGRAVNAELVERVFSEWRRPGSPCDGGMVLALSDLRPGAGFGLVDAAGRRKAPWHAFRRVAAPLAVFLTDEGLNGLDVHVANDTRHGFSGVLRLELFAHGSVLTEAAEQAMTVGPGSATTVNSSQVLPGFRDVTYAYRFSPPAHDLVVASLCDEDGTVVSEAVHLPLGMGRPVETDLGLTAVARAEGDVFSVEVSATRFAQWAHLDLPGFEPQDDWFHLLPGRPRTVAVHPEPGGPGRPRGSLLAINCSVPAAVTVIS